MNLNEILELLRKEGKKWRCDAAEIMNEIPAGHLATYGTIARLTNERYGHKVTARNIGWLRRHIYEITDRMATIPLHRIACRGDMHCKKDSVTTRRTAVSLRQREGTLDNPRWWNG